MMNSFSARIRHRVLQQQFSYDVNNKNLGQQRRTVQLQNAIMQNAFECNHVPAVRRDAQFAPPKFPALTFPQHVINLNLLATYYNVQCQILTHMQIYVGGGWMLRQFSVERASEILAPLRDQNSEWIFDVLEHNYLVSLTSWLLRRQLAD